MQKKFRYWGKVRKNFKVFLETQPRDDGENNNFLFGHPSLIIYLFHKKTFPSYKINPKGVWSNW